MASTTSSLLPALVQAARQVQPRAYAPYSGFQVGAAVLGASGHMYAGCNVENSSFGLSLCAERSAVAAAVAAGERELLALAIATSAERPTPPCGACRQVLLELSRSDAVVLATSPGGQRTWKLLELLPDAFTQADVSGSANTGPR